MRPDNMHANWSMIIKRVFFFFDQKVASYWSKLFQLQYSSSSSISSNKDRQESGLGEGNLGHSVWFANVLIKVCKPCVPCPVQALNDIDLLHSPQFKSILLLVSRMHDIELIESLIEAGFGCKKKWEAMSWDEWWDDHHSSSVSYEIERGSCAAWAINL